MDVSPCSACQWSGRVAKLAKLSPSLLSLTTKNVGFGIDTLHNHNLIGIYWLTFICVQCTYDPHTKLENWFNNPNLKEQTNMIGQYSYVACVISYMVRVA